MLKPLRTAASKAVAAAIAEARHAAGLTQRDLAARLQRPHSVVGMIEANQRQVAVPELISIADALEIDPVSLLRRALKMMSGG